MWQRANADADDDDDGDSGVPFVGDVWRAFEEREARLKSVIATDRQKQQSWFDPVL